MAIENPHVLVTGAAGALGGAVVRSLLARGCRVTACASPGNLERAAALGASGGRLLVLEGNVSVPAECERLCTEAEGALNPIDGVVACAGGWKGGRPTWEAPETELDELFTRNFKTTYLTLRAGARRMVSRGHGRLIAIASQAAFDPEPGAAAYAVAKAAVVHFVKVLARELAGTGVAVSCLAPGTLDTPANRDAMPAADRSRWVKLDQAVDAIVNLLSMSPAAMNGAVLPLGR